MRKVTMPNRKEVEATTIVVIITVFIFGVYFWIVDSVLIGPCAGSYFQVFQHH